MQTLAVRFAEFVVKCQSSIYDKRSITTSDDSYSFVLKVISVMAITGGIWHLVKYVNSTWVFSYSVCTVIDDVKVYI